MTPRMMDIFICRHSRGTDDVTSASCKRMKCQGLCILDDRQILEDAQMYGSLLTNLE
jgi:hypothetical protein